MNFAKLENEKLLESYNDIKNFINYLEKEINNCETGILEEDK